MNHINVGRVVLGGLLAGLVLNIGEFLLNGVILAESMKTEFERLRLPELGGDFYVKVILATFVVGIVMVYLYAAIRPRFGPGVKAALCSGLIVWFFVYLYTGVVQGSLGLFSAKPIIIGIVWGLVQYSLSAIAGAWVYRETA